MSFFFQRLTINIIVISQKTVVEFDNRNRSSSLGCTKMSNIFTFPGKLKNILEHDTIQKPEARPSNQLSIITVELEIWSDKRQISRWLMLSANLYETTELFLINLWPGNIYHWMSFQKILVLSFPLSQPCVNACRNPTWCKMCSSPISSHTNIT